MTESKEFVDKFQHMIGSVTEELDMMYSLEEAMRNFNIDTPVELPEPNTDEFEELSDPEKDEVEILREFAENYGYMNSDYIVATFVENALDITYETELSSGEITSVTLTLTTGGPHIELILRGNEGTVEGWWGDTHLTKSVYSYNHIGYDICEQIFDYIKEIALCK